MYREIIEQKVVEGIIETLEISRENQFNSEQRDIDELISKIERQDETGIILNDLQDLLRMLSADAYAMGLSAGIRLAKATPL